MKKFVMLCMAVLLLQSCAWVKLTPEGEKVRVLDAGEVGGCREIGTTTSSVKADIAGVARKESKVREELQALARNAAVDMNGDTVVPLGAPLDGRQVFAVYRCVNP
jgi:hypothetical protein